MTSTRSQRSGAAAAPAMLLAAALLAIIAMAYSQPVDDGYGPMPSMPGTGGDGYGTATPGPAVKPGMSKLCPKSLYDKSGKVKTADFEACARKVLKAWNDGYTGMTDPMAILDHYARFTMPDSNGRITPIATAGGGHLPEYNAILAFPNGIISIITPNNASTSPVRYYVRRLIARPPIIAATTDVVITNMFTQKVANLTFGQWFRIDKATNRIAVVDVDAMRYQEFLTYLGVPDILKTYPDLMFGQMKATVCGAHTQFCTGPLQQYKDQAECEAFLTALPLMDFSTMQGNNTFCRFLHSSLLPFEPAIHCSHISKTSATCRNIPYDSYYQDTRFTAPTFVMGGKF